MKESSDPLDGRQHTAAIGTAKLPPNDLYRNLYFYVKNVLSEILPKDFWSLY